MVRRIVWSAQARAARDRDIAWLAERDDDAARRRADAIDEWVEGLARRPLGTGHQWPGYLTFGDKKLNKRIVYEVFDDRIEIAAFFDMRQDTTGLPPPPRRR